MSLLPLRNRNTDDGVLTVVLDECPSCGVYPGQTHAPRCETFQHMVGAPLPAPEPIEVSPNPRTFLDDDFLPARAFVREDVPGNPTPIYVTYVQFGETWLRVSDIEAVTLRKLGTARYCVESVMRSGNRFRTDTFRRKRDAQTERERLVGLVCGDDA